MQDPAPCAVREQAPLDSHNRLDAMTSGVSKALLIWGTKPSAEDRRLGEVLTFFGVSWEAATAGELSGSGSPAAKLAGTAFCTLGSAPRMAEAIDGIADSKSALPRWITEADSVYVYGFEDTEACRKLLRLLTCDAQASIRHFSSPQVVMSITEHLPELCGPMSGMHVPVEAAGGAVFGVARQGNGFQSLIRTNDGELFFSVVYQGVRVYLNASRSMVDLSAPAETHYDVKKIFCEAVPTAMYIRQAFRDVYWKSPETSACLIVDDPVLKPRYGFLRFRDTLNLMDQFNFITTIAFIPWNWRRTDSRTVALFQKRPDRLSLCVHGCDHTASEFAVRSTALLNERLKTAIKRMEMLYRKTSLPCDRVMVFPQGEFSPETGRVLKLNGLFAAVNTGVAPSNNARNETRVADLWSVANTRYGTFPIFTRRYLTSGIENFAFDALLGKPCLIAAHHDVFKDRGRELADFMAKLNSLKCNLRWRTLGAAVQHSFRIRPQTGGTFAVQMFAESLAAENPSQEPRELVFWKEEGDPESVKAVTVNQMPVNFRAEDGYLRFGMRLGPRQAAEIRVNYFDNLGMPLQTDSLKYRIKTRARRYLSEFRDNYLSQNDFLYESAMGLWKRIG